MYMMILHLTRANLLVQAIHQQRTPRTTWMIRLSTLSRVSTTALTPSRTSSHLPGVARIDTSRRLGKKNVAFYHRSILQITRHLQRRHYILQAEAKAKEAEREREEGEMLNEAERDRRRRHLKNVKERNRKRKINGFGLPADLLRPLEDDGGKQDDVTLLRRARARRSGLSREEAAVFEMENVLVSFEDSMQPDLNQFDDVCLRVRLSMFCLCSLSR